MAKSFAIGLEQALTRHTSAVEKQLAVVRAWMAEYDADCELVTQFIHQHIPDMVVSPFRRITWDSHGMPSIERTLTLTRTRRDGASVQEDYLLLIGDLQAPDTQAGLVQFVVKCKART